MEYVRVGRENTNRSLLSFRPVVRGVRGRRGTWGGERRRAAWIAARAGAVRMARRRIVPTVSVVALACLHYAARRCATKSESKVV